MNERRAFLGQVPLRGMGQASGPSSPGTASAPAGTAAGNAIAAAAQPSFFDQSFQPDFFNQGFFNNYPIYPQYYPPAPQPQQLVCKRHVDENTGEETFDCTPKNPAPPTYRYPVYFPTFF